MDGEILPRIAAFLERYALYLAVAAAAIVHSALRARRHFRRKSEVYDPALTPEWSERRSTFASEGVVGRWQGRAVRIRRLTGYDKRFDTIEVSVATPASGAFAIERRDVGFRWAIRIGGPPAVEPMDPADRRELRVRSNERSVPDRLLADPAVRSGLRENLRAAGDELSLRRGRLRVVRRVHRNEPAAPAVRSAWALLKEAARVLG